MRSGEGIGPPALALSPFQQRSEGANQRNPERAAQEAREGILSEQTDEKDIMSLGTCVCKDLESLWKFSDSSSDTALRD